MPFETKDEVRRDDRKTAGGRDIKQESPLEREQRWRKEIAEDEAKRKAEKDGARQARVAAGAALHATKAREIEEYRKLHKAATARLSKELPDMLIAACKGERKYKGKAVPEILVNIASALNGMVDRLAQDEVQAQMPAVRERLAKEAMEKALAESAARGDPPVVVMP